MNEAERKQALRQIIKRVKLDLSLPSHMQKKGVVIETFKISLYPDDSSVPSIQLKYQDKILKEWSIIMNGVWTMSK